MRKQAKKLVLSKETLRALTDPSLARAIGGNKPWPTYFDINGCTTSELCEPATEWSCGDPGLC
jgi:hypothetical protein